MLAKSHYILGMTKPKAALTSGDLLLDYLDKSGLTQTRFAGMVGVHPSMIWQWIRDERPISAISAREIEAATDGALTRYQLRSDVFGDDPSRRKTK